MLRMGAHCPDALRRRQGLERTQSVWALRSHAERGNEEQNSEKK